MVRSYAAEVTATAGIVDEASDGGFTDVLPEGGRLVLFDSRTCKHEVTPTPKERVCCVGWFRRGS